MTMFMVTVNPEQREEVVEKLASWSILPCHYSLRCVETGQVSKHDLTNNWTMEEYYKIVLNVV